MLSIRTILHPTDFSDRSQYALQVAAALARDHGARLHVLHVVPTPILAYGEGVVPAEPESVLREAREQLDRLVVPAPEPPAERRVKDGDPVAVILRVARELPADLIVMGTHGRTGLGRLLMGSVAEQVVRRAACPVLTVSAPFPQPAAGMGVAEQLGVAGPM